MIAQQVTPSDPTSLLLSYGLTPIVLVILSLLGWVWFKPAVDNLLNRLAKLEEKLDAREDFIRTVVMPAVSESNELLKEVATLLARRRAG